MPVKDKYSLESILDLYSKKEHRIIFRSICSGAKRPSNINTPYQYSILYEFLKNMFSLKLKNWK